MSASFAEGRIKLVSSSSFLPGELVSNQELFDVLGSHCGRLSVRKANLIAKRLGIKSRHLCRKLDSAKPVINTNAVTMASSALLAAAKAANLDLNTISYLIGHTTSPATLIPPNIAWVADELSFTNPYMELRQACTGFANGLQIAAAMLNGSSASYIAIVGSEAGSMYCDFSPEFLDQEQLVNFVQMGDGAGAVILAADDHSGEQVLSDLYFGHIGVGKQPAFFLEGGGSNQPYCEHGFPQFKHDVTGVKERGEALFTQGLNAILSRGYSLEDFDFIIPHQVNGHLARLVSEALQVSSEKVIVDADTLGNMGSAAIWVSLDRLITSGKLEKGNKVLVLGAEATKYMYGGFVYTH